MGITNAQIAVHLEQVTEATAASTAAFVATFEKLIENDNRHHEQFRARLEEITLASALAQAETENNTAFRGQVGKWVYAVILVPIGTMIVQLLRSK